MDTSSVKSYRHERSCSTASSCNPPLVYRRRLWSVLFPGCSESVDRATYSHRNGLPRLWTRPLRACWHTHDRPPPGCVPLGVHSGGYSRFLTLGWLQVGCCSRACAASCGRGLLVGVCLAHPPNL